MEYDTACIQKGVENYLKEIQHIFHNNLIDCYLHGSMAMGCFQLGRSDVDLLVITKHLMNVFTNYRYREV